MILLKKSKNIIKYTYNEFCENSDGILSKFGSNGFVMYTENKAFVYFDTTPEWMIYVIGEKRFEKDSFTKLGGGFDVIGKKGNKSICLFIEDIKNNIRKILIMSLFYVFIFNPYTFDKEVFIGVTDKLVDIVSIFIGMVFVFIGFFYGDKERTIEVYKKGLCDEEFSTDRYVLLLAFSSIILLVISNILAEVSLINLVSLFIPTNVCNIILQYNIKYYFCVLLLYLAVVNILICFDSLINYYLKTMRNKYLIDAVKETIKERNEK